MAAIAKQAKKEQKALEAAQLKQVYYSPLIARLPPYSARIKSLAPFSRKLKARRVVKVAAKVAAVERRRERFDPQRYIHSFAYIYPHSLLHLTTPIHTAFFL